MSCIPYYSNSEWIELPKAKREIAWKRGEIFHRISNERKYHDYCQASPEERLYRHCIGELAACAIAELLKIPYTWSLDTFEKADLPFNIEAKSMMAENYCLKVRVEDPIEKRVVGCIIERGKEHLPYRIPGWINAKFGKKEKWFSDPNNWGQPAYWVPQNKLRHLDLLRDLIKRDEQNNSVFNQEGRASGMLKAMRGYQSIGAGH